jgi:hypothetical protein
MVMRLRSSKKQLVHARGTETRRQQNLDAHHAALDEWKRRFGRRVVLNSLLSILFAPSRSSENFPRIETNSIDAVAADRVKARELIAL